MAATQVLALLATTNSTFRYFGDFSSQALLLTLVAALLLLDTVRSWRWKDLLELFFVGASIYGLFVTLTYYFCGFQCLFIQQVPQVARFMDHLVGH
jgi:hypothetical protein